jgi:type II secretory pathway pseudopilin PulG
LRISEGEMRNKENRCASGSDRFARRRSALRTPHSAFLSRTALTLIELLVVVIILTTLVAAAIPLLTPTDDQRRLREASRGLNTFITGAQAKAIQLHRPFGIALKKLSQDTGRSDPTDPLNDNGACLEVYYVEQPPAFTGFDEMSAVRVAINPESDGGMAIQFVRRGTARPFTDDRLPYDLDSDLPPNTIRHLDVVEVAGMRYQLTDTDFDANGFYRPDSGEPDGELWARPLNGTGQMVNGQMMNLMNYVDRDPDTSDPDRATLFWTKPLSYKTRRQPTYTSAPPYQLPEGTAIDLRGSGDGQDSFYDPDVSLASGLQVNNGEPVVIMFAPEGSIQRVRFSMEPGNTAVDNESFDELITSNVFLLVGRRENIPSPAVTTAADPTLDPSKIVSGTDQQLAELREPINWLRSESRWVVIGARSGRVVTVENAFVDLRALGNDGDYQSAALPVRRSRQIDEARMDAREMTQVGGR